MTTTTASSPDPKPRTIYSAQPIRWPHLDDEKSAEQLDELTDWVLWLTWRFNLDHRTVPDCWNQHGAVIEELSALYTAWQTAYAQTADGDSPLAWMNQFANSRHRLTDCVARTGCRPSKHRRKADASCQ